MPQTNLGRVAFKFQGDYSALTTYAKYDVVFDGESSFVSQIDNNLGNELVDGLNWKYLAKGNNLSLQDLKQDVTDLETDLNGTIDDTSHALHELTQNTGGNIFVYKSLFDIGNILMTTDGWVYSSANTRVRTREGTTLNLKVGDIIRFNSYSNLRFYVGWLANGVYTDRGWLTSDFTCFQDGEYVLLITTISGIVITDASELMQNLEIVRGDETKLIIDLYNRSANGTGSISSKLRNGQLNTLGNVAPINYRVYTKDYLQYDKNVIVSANDGYLLYVVYYDGSYYATTEDWVSVARVPANSKFYLTIRKKIENTSVVADINEFRYGVSIRYEEEYDMSITCKAICTSRIPIANHRGLRTTLTTPPENSTKSFIASGESKSWAIETDIRETLDGYFICMHDSSVDRTTNGTGIVSNMTLAEIQTLALSDDLTLTVPTLDEYLGICKMHNCVALLELKGINSTTTSITKVINAIVKHGMQNKCIIITTSIYMVRYWRYIDTKFPLLFVATYMTGLTNNYREICGYPNCGFNVERELANSLTDEQLNEYHRNGMIVGVWSSNTISEIQQLFSRGFDFVTSDYIATY